MYNIITSSEYNLPHLAPDGNYCPSSVQGDLNYDGVINISDIIILVNSIIMGVYSIQNDLNLDSQNDILDIIYLVNIILDVN